jgi:hypothetical protein
VSEVEVGYSASSEVWMQHLSGDQRDLCIDG